MDYLSLDVDAANGAVLDSFPFDKYRFRVLTIEHNVYEAEDTPLLNVQKQAREVLAKHGYTLVCANVQHGGKSFEDWWVDAATVPEIWRRLQCVENDGRAIAEKCRSLT
jgi:hypothetical protein